LRIKKVLPYLQGSHILDFGCGSHFSALKIISNNSSAQLYGLDSYFKGHDPIKVSHNITLFGSLKDLADAIGDNSTIDTMISLACFEHLSSDEFVGILNTLNLLTSQNCRIIGTVPTKAAKPVLEFLSFNLKLIDPSQIEDHKVYYDEELLRKTLVSTSWKMETYQTFQFGWNSFFIFSKKVNL
jgi:hypothetical protein